MKKRQHCAVIAAAMLVAATAGLTQAAEKKHEPATHEKHEHAAASAETSRVLGTADAWTAYYYKDKSGRVCYLVGKAEKTEPASAKRKPPTAMVTHRPDEKVFNVVSFVAGYPFKDGSSVDLDIDGKKFDLFTKDDAAWSRTSETDKTITEALAKGKTAIVKGTPRRGAKTADTYALHGFSQALAMIDKACDVKR